MTDAQVQFLHDRLDEDERIARAAAWDEDVAAKWRAGSTPHGGVQGAPRWYVEDAYEDAVVSRVDPQGSEDQGIAEHIARHDPAHALAEIEAKRKAVDACAYFLHDSEDGPDPCASAVLAALTQPYADHPGYREEWKL